MRRRVTRSLLAFSVAVAVGGAMASPGLGQDVAPRRLGNTGVVVDVPPSWTLAASAAAFRFADGDRELPLSIYPDRVDGGVFERLPRGPTVTERVLPSGAEHYRREDRDRLSIVVRVRLDEERAFLCATPEPALEGVCRSLRRE